jgi:hypothetical protein
VTLDEDRLVFSAEFVPADAIAAADGHGRVTVRRPDGTELCHLVKVCEASHSVGEKVHVIAMADPIADFSEFDGPCDEVELNRCTGRIAADEPFVAVFDVPEVTLTLRVAPLYSPGVLVIGNDTVCGLSVGLWTCTVRVAERGPNVNVHASSGSFVPTEFDRWTGACTGPQPTCAIDPSLGRQSLTGVFH